MPLLDAFSDHDVRVSLDPVGLPAARTDHDRLPQKPGPGQLAGLV